MNYEVKLNKLTLEHPIINGAGICKNMEGDDGFNRFVNRPFSAITIGSYTQFPIECPEGEMFVSRDNFTLNSAGLHNKGFQYLLDNLKNILGLSHEKNKPVIISISADDNFYWNEMLVHLNNYKNIDILELNLSCPNKWHDGKQIKIPCFDLHLFRDILDMCSMYDLTISLKLSPYSDPFLIELISTYINDSTIKLLTLCNTFPNCLWLENGKSILKRELSGMGGKNLKPIVLGQIKQFKQFLNKDVQIIGCGGIYSWNDVKDYLTCGATCVELTSSFLEDGRIIDKILDEMIVDETTI